MSYGILFPPDRNHSVRMAIRIRDNFPEFAKILEELESTMGFRVSQWCFDESETYLEKSWIRQLSISVFNMALFKLFLNHSKTKEISAISGLSLGETQALYVCGILGLESFARLIIGRADLLDCFDRKDPGGMILAKGLSESEIMNLCAEIGEGLAPISDFINNQTVLSGRKKGIEMAKDLCGNKAEIITSQMAFHSLVLAPAIGPLFGLLRNFVFEKGQHWTRFVSSVTGQIATEAEECKWLLAIQPALPYRLRGVLQTFRSLRITTVVIPATGTLLKKSILEIDPSFEVLNLGNHIELEKILKGVETG